MLRNEGNPLGKWYYTGKTGNKDAEVLSRVENIDDYLNNGLTFEPNQTKEAYSGKDFKEETVSDEDKVKVIYNMYGEPKTELINTTITNTDKFSFLKRIDNTDTSLKDRYVYKTIDDGKTKGEYGNTDYSKVVRLTKTLDLDEMNKDEGITIPSYMSEITSFSSATGRRNMQSTPGNVEYVYSADSEMTLDSAAYKSGDETNFAHYIYSNGFERNVKIIDKVRNAARNVILSNLHAERLSENDEFWGEKIIITKPTGEDKAFPIEVVSLITTSVAIVGVGIFLIKKLVLDKKNIK